jgi:hypothetical protein
MIEMERILTMLTVQCDYSDQCYVDTGADSSDAISRAM